MDARLIGKTPTGYEITAGTDIFGNNFRFCIAKFIDGSEAAVIFSPIDESAEDAVRRCATETIQCTTEPIKFSIVLAKLYGIREFAAI
ncbi:MAG: hypothetical protein LBB38_01740, partial [Puniceicoccales bacterium]|nr:hypothetical protein [Puniceicoccales bacterium]